MRGRCLAYGETLSLRGPREGERDSRADLPKLNDLLFTQGVGDFYDYTKRQCDLTTAPIISM